MRKDLLGFYDGEAVLDGCFQSMDNGLYASTVSHWVRNPLDIRDYWVFENEMALVFNGFKVRDLTTHVSMDDSASDNRQYFTFHRLESPVIDAAWEWVREHKSDSDP